jgi:hypothetical protein
MIYGPIDDNSIWRIRQNNELYALCNELDVVRVMKIGRLRWLGQLFRMHEVDPCRKLTLIKPEGTRRVGKPKLRWLESAEGDLKMGVRNWRRMSQDREQWGCNFWKKLSFTKNCNARRRRRRRRRFKNSAPNAQKTRYFCIRKANKLMLRMFNVIAV